MIRLSSGALMAVLCLGGCPKTNGVPTGPEEDPIVYDGLECPENTRAVGGAPPVGTQVWCNLTLANGTQVRHGPSFMWHANGQLAAQGQYAEDGRDGDWKFYSARGTMEMQGSYLFGKEDGEWIYYHPSGEKSESGRFVNGGRNGEWSYWNSAGIESKGTWVDGKREGTWVELDHNGDPLRERTYRDGRVIEQKELVGGQ